MFGAHDGRQTLFDNRKRDGTVSCHLTFSNGDDMTEDTKDIDVTTDDVQPLQSVEEITAIAWVRRDTAIAWVRRDMIVDPGAVESRAFTDARDAIRWTRDQVEEIGGGIALVVPHTTKLAYDFGGKPVRESYSMWTVVSEETPVHGMVVDLGPIVDREAMREEFDQ